jgi:hypothetical protein
VLGRFAAIMAVNLPRVAHAAQVGAPRVTRGARVLRLSFGFAPRSASGRSG